MKRSASPETAGLPRIPSDLTSTDAPGAVKSDGAGQQNPTPVAEQIDQQNMDQLDGIVSPKSTTLCASTLVGSGEAKAASERVQWDKEMPGLGQRIRPGKQVVWIFQVKVDGKSIKQTIGGIEKYSPEEARESARRIRHQLTDCGGEPEHGLLFEQFAQTFLRDCQHQWKPETYESYRWIEQRKLRGFFGKLPIALVEKSDVVAWFTSDRGHCKRALSVLSSLMKHAELLGARPEGSNPCVGLRRKQSTFKANYLAQSEYRALGRLLRWQFHVEPEAARAVKFLCLTGARAGEAAELRWPNINNDRAILADGKTGPMTIWLGSSTQKLLATLPRIDDQSHVFRKRSGRRFNSQDLSNYWRKIRPLAGLERYRLHDLRHGYASTAVAGGEELRTVGKLLNHADYSSTLAYAHLAEKPVADAADRVSRVIKKKMRR